MPLFTPPTRNEGSSDFFFGRYSIPVGQTVVRTGGTFSTTPYPWLGDIADLTEGVDYFLGGRSYVVSAEAAAELEGDGYQVTRLVNGSFEEGLTGWSVPGDVSISESVVFEGTKSAAASADGDSEPPAALTQTIAVEPGSTYRLTGRWKFDSTAWAFPRLTIKANEVSGTEPGVWELVETTFTAGGSGTVVLSLHPASKAGGTTTWFDDFALERL